MCAHVSRARTFPEAAHVLKMSVVTNLTAGDLLRKTIADGEEKRALAARLAGGRADKAAIERWRGVVTRAVRDGKEPTKPAQRERIAEVFDLDVSLPTAASNRARRAALEEEVADLRAAGGVLLDMATLLFAEVTRMGGKLPAEILESSALEVLRRPREAGAL